MSFLLHLVLWGLMLLMYSASGATLSRLLTGSAEFEREGGWTALLLIGLLFQLTLFWLLLRLGLPRVSAMPLSVLPAVFSLPVCTASLVRWRPQMSYSFLLWFSVILGLGVSLFDIRPEGIVTPWKNNYGDLTFHLGMITRFTTGGAVDFDYHLFPGSTLSYPFFINLWSASLWWDTTQLSLLPVLFCYQWLVCWFAVYVLLRGGTFPLLPWLILFGGGSYYLIGEYSWEFIGKGKPWTVFLSSLWVTQRSLLLGLPASLVVIRLVHRAEHCLEESERVKLLSLAGVTLGLMPLAHTHFFIITALLTGGTLIVRGLFQKLKGASAGSYVSVDEFNRYVTCSCIAILTFPVLLTKSSMLGIQPGWTGVAPTGEGMSTLMQSLSMWFESIPLLVLCILVFAWYRPKVPFLISLCIVFLLCNVVSLSIWQWDQVKVFVALYVLWIGYYAQEFDKEEFVLHWAAFPLLVPGLVEAALLFHEGPLYTVYTRKEMQVAETIRDVVPEGAIVAGASRHNSPVTLTGRSLYMGYEGTLQSHGLPYQERKKRFEDIEQLIACQKDPCPEYLLYTEHEQALWRTLPEHGITRTGVPTVYRIVRDTNADLSK